MADINIETVLSLIEKFLNDKKINITVKFEEDRDNINLKKRINGFVIDTSVIGSKNLFSIINEICNNSTEEKIILTSITVEELERIQKTAHDFIGTEAQKLIRLATDTPEIFVPVLIDETLSTPDGCIIKYCADNKNAIKLLTSDRTMVLKARAHGINVIYLKKEFTQNHSLENLTKLVTVFFSEYNEDNNSLTINLDSTGPKNLISVISNKTEYSSGIVEFKVGDDIFISAKKNNYITFAHYRIISLYRENHAEVIYHVRINYVNDTNVIENNEYLEFIKKAKEKFNI